MYQTYPSRRFLLARPLPSPRSATCARATCPSSGGRAGGGRRGYAQLSYTFQKRSRTDYVQPEDVERIKSEMANYRKFKELCERLVALSIEESKRKTEQRRKALAAVRSQS